MADMKTPRRCFAYGVFGGTIVVAGGEGLNGINLDSVEEYVPA